MRVNDIAFNNIFSDEILYEKITKNILIYDISYKIFMGAKPLRIRFDEIDGFIKIYDGIRYLVLFSNIYYYSHVWYDEICDWVRYLITEKSVITDSINSYNSYNFNLNSL